MNPMRPFNFNNVHEDGFTLVELLVVLATIGILAVLLLPAIAGTKPNSQAFQCLENQRQLTIGWRMYAEDNSDKLVPNGDQQHPLYGTLPTDLRLQSGGLWYQWAPGSMQTTFLYQTNYLLVSALYPYVKTINVYKCPADFSNFTFPVSPHTRSYSMNCYLSPIIGNGTQAHPDGSWTSVGLDGTRNFFRDSDLVQPGPSTTFVLIDENERSINDSYFISDPTQGNYWQDIPAIRHSGACVLSYADGRSEMKRWTDSNILGFKGVTGPIGGAPNSTDAAWLQARATSFTK
jgi:prepilin-type N-terminal cleavage/methylation domain-containing protein